MDCWSCAAALELLVILVILSAELLVPQTVVLFVQIVVLMVLLAI